MRFKEFLLEAKQRTKPSFGKRLEFKIHDCILVLEWAPGVKSAIHKMIDPGDEASLEKVKRVTPKGRIRVEIIDDYNRMMGYTQYFPDTKEGYKEAVDYYNKLAPNLGRLPTKVPLHLRGTLPDAE